MYQNVFGVPRRATACSVHTGENIALSFQNIKSLLAGSLTEPAKHQRKLSMLQSFTGRHFLNAHPVAYLDQQRKGI